MIRTKLAAALSALAVCAAIPAAVSVASPPTSPAVASEAAQVQVTVRDVRGTLAIIAARLAPRGAASRTVILQMYDGDQAVLALPGHPGTRFHFRRSGDLIITAVDG